VKDSMYPLDGKRTKSLFLISDKKKGDLFGPQHYWGDFAVRKPKHDVRTVSPCVELGLFVMSVFVIFEC
jgi:hypothetical protein